MALTLYLVPLIALLRLLRLHTLEKKFDERESVCVCFMFILCFILFLVVFMI